MVQGSVFIGKVSHLEDQEECRCDEIRHQAGYVYISYSRFASSPVNYSVGHVYDGGPGGVSTGLNSGQQDTPSGFNASGIKVTACMESNAGWACGKGKSV